MARDSKVVMYVAGVMILTILLTAVAPYLGIHIPQTNPSGGNKLGGGTKGSLKYIVYRLEPNILTEVFDDVWLGDNPIESKYQEYDLSSILEVNVLNYTIDKIEVKATVGKEGWFCSGGEYEIEIAAVTPSGNMITLYYRSGSITQSSYAIEEDGIIAEAFQGSKLKIYCYISVKAKGWSGKAYLRLEYVAIYITAYYMEG